MGVAVGCGTGVSVGGGGKVAVGTAVVGTGVGCTGTGVAVAGGAGMVAATFTASRETPATGSVTLAANQPTSPSGNFTKYQLLSLVFARSITNTPSAMTPSEAKAVPGPLRIFAEFAMISTCG